jgi:hypothetical protein
MGKIVDSFGVDDEFTALFAVHGCVEQLCRL